MRRPSRRGGNWQRVHRSLVSALTRTDIPTLTAPILQNPACRAMSFESNLKRLDAIVAQLEGDRLDLNAALGLFEEGIELLRLASGELAETETRVKELIERADGVLELRDFGA